MVIPIRRRHGTIGLALALAASAGWWSRSMAEPPPATQPADVAGLKQQRVQTLRTASDLALQLYSRGLGDVLPVLQCDEALAAARLAYAGTPAERLAALRDAKATADQHEALAASRFKAGLTSDLDVNLFKAHRLDVEIQLAEAAGQ